MNKQVQDRIEKYPIYTFLQRKKADQRSAFSLVREMSGVKKTLDKSF